MKAFGEDLRFAQHARDAVRVRTMWPGVLGGRCTRSTRTRAT